MSTWQRAGLQTHSCKKIKEGVEGVVSDVFNLRRKSGGGLKNLVRQNQHCLIQVRVSS